MNHQTYLIPYLYYGKLASRHRLYFGNQPKNVQENELKVINTKPVCRFMIDMSTLIFSLPYVLMVFGIDVRQWQFTDILFRVLPPEAAENVEICVTLWQALYLIIHFWTLKRNLCRAQFSAVFVVHSDTKSSRGISRKDLGLTKINCYKLVCFQRRLLAMLDLITVNLVIFISCCCVFQLYRSGVMIQHPWFSFLWLFIINFWLVVLATTNYAFPILLLVLNYYLLLKYKRFECKIRNLTFQLKASPGCRRKSVRQLSMRRVSLRRRANWFRRFCWIYRQFTKLCREIELYQDEVCRGLSAFYFAFILLDAYLAYLAFFVEHLPLEYNVVFCALFLLLAIVLAVITFSCAKITAIGGEFIKMAQHYHQVLTRRKQVHHRVLLKFDNLIECIRQKQIGFTLIDGVPITSKTFFMIFFNMSCFFFLLFKHNHQ